MTPEQYELVKATIAAAGGFMEAVVFDVMLAGRGKNLVGRCPFHPSTQEAGSREASLVVSPHRAMFHCFWCGTGGRVQQMIQQLGGKSRLTVDIQILQETT